jgi:hypothetical protein
MASSRASRASTKSPSNVCATPSRRAVPSAIGPFHDPARAASAKRAARSPLPPSALTEAAATASGACPSIWASGSRGKKSVLGRGPTSGHCGSESRRHRSQRLVATPIARQSSPACAASGRVGRDGSRERKISAMTRPSTTAGSRTNSEFFAAVALAVSTLTPHLHMVRGGAADDGAAHESQS